MQSIDRYGLSWCGGCCDAGSLAIFEASVPYEKIGLGVGPPQKKSALYSQMCSPRLIMSQTIAYVRALAVNGQTEKNMRNTKYALLPAYRTVPL